ncbi:MAG: hypothetical protein U5R48_09095 [Gammaproteobacteria bacterium]|nr:hypothetical protein [Gammaproteobacteria bacterium]
MSTRPNREVDPRPRTVLRSGIRGTSPSLALVIALVAPAIGASPADLMACAFPEPPRIAGGCEASDRDFDRSRRAVQRFVSGVEESLACIEAYEATLDAPDDRTQARINGLYNNGVDQMHLIAEAFNHQLRQREGGCSDDLVSEPGAEAVAPDQLRELQRGHHH